MTRIVIIANPISGHGRGARLSRDLANLLTARGDAVDLRPTTAERNGTQLARDLDLAGDDRLVVVGGDGSVNDVLNGLPHLRAPIAVLPAGTANVWAREMRLPRDAAGHAGLLANGRVIDVALGRANGQRFFLFVGAGLDARIVEAVEQRRRRRRGKGGMSQWWTPALRIFFGRPHADLTAEVAGRSLPHQGQVLVTRVRKYAASFDMGDTIDATDGKLHVLAFPRRSKLAWLGLGLRALRGAWRDGIDRTHVTTTEPVHIDAVLPEPYHVDGSHAGLTPVDITLEPQSARFVVPALL